jgi:DnaJ-class molecular chaperone
MRSGEISQQSSSISGHEHSSCQETVFTICLQYHAYIFLLQKEIHFHGLTDADCSRPKLIDFPIYLQALCGTRVDIPLLGGERTVVNLQDEIVKPTTVKRMVGKGLPLPKDPSRRGDLVISFDIVFPDRLPTTTRELFRNNLPSK